MPSRSSLPVLSVDTGKLHRIDTANVQSLHGMWMVFSKCADFIEEGRRLENLSWRLWTRETFCVEPEESSDTSVLPLLRAESGDVPELSASVDSAASDEAERLESYVKRPQTLDYKPAVVGEDPILALYRGKEKHITSTALERMVLGIKEKKALKPLSLKLAPITRQAVDITPAIDVTPRPSSPTPAPVPQTEVSVPTYLGLRQQHQSAESCSTTAPEGNDSDAVPTAGSDTSVSSSGMLPSKPSLLKSQSIVRGFSPSQVSSSYRSNTRLAPDSCVPAKAISMKMATLQKPSPIKQKYGMFTLGASSGDDESSFEDRMGAITSVHAPAPHRSSLTEELNKPDSGNSVSAPSKKVASFKDQVEMRTIRPITETGHEDEDAVATEDEVVSESAIEDDDDDSEWDSITESGRSSVDEKELFQRVDSRPNLISRRSLLTMMMHQPAKMNATRSSPALQRSRPATLDTGEQDDSLTMRGPDVPRSKPITVKAIPQAASAHSPRTTRRNMLANELTESLRRHLLWERQQKSTTANAVFKRRHTAHDMANLQEYPTTNAKGQKPSASVTGPNGVAPSKDKDISKNSSWNNYYDYGPWEYHAKGW